MEQFNNSEVNTNNKKVQKNNGPFCFLVWIFKVEIVILLVLLIIKCIPDKTKFIIKYNIEKNFSYSSLNQDIKDIAKIDEALEKNKNLSDEEKQIITDNLKTEILENIEYVDINRCFKKIKNLKIVYPDQNSNFKSAENILNPAGSYSNFLNKITIYEKDNEVYMHELNHLISENEISSFFSIDLLSEIINEHFAREYTDASEIEGYDAYMFYSFALAKLLPEEDIKKYKFTEKQSILISSLLEIDNNIDNAYEFLSSINFEKGFDKNFNKNFEKFHDLYNYYYKKKYNMEIKDDIELLLCFYNSPIQTKEERQIVKDYFKLEDNDKIINIIPKGFFSEKYKEEHPKAIIEIIKKDKKETFEI